MYGATTHENLARYHKKTNLPKKTVVQSIPEGVHLHIKNIYQTFKRTLNHFSPSDRKNTHVRILGADTTSSTCGRVQDGYLFGLNANVFWSVSTYISLMIFVYPRIGIDLGTEGQTIPLVHSVGKNLLRSTVVFFFTLCGRPYY